ncbi:protein TIC 62, chloroplastic [Lolium rigidum]|uniref:protein TIC 62, chloroplastic n=1 Tax=Lolium rigidum TaxID=89674 RepID=UPI001F5DBCEF|nr:protein TIC 62, chloroplastic [Lolium rigidum]
MEAKAAAVSLSAPLPRCRISNMLACSARRSSRRCRYHHGAPLRSLAASSSARSFPAARVYASAATTPAKEQDLVFVAGATGKVGSRTVRELIKLGFRVRAAVRSKQRASPLVQSVERLELGEGTASSRLELVECDLEKQGDSAIAAAIGGASLVVCSIGASEKEILDVTGPYRIDYLATANLVRAAASAGVEHFVLVTSLGTTRVGFPAALLNLFWGVLYWKKLAEEALVASGVPYTIVRPGGMERPTDAYKETHNLVVAPRDTYVGGLVSNLQIAELIACVAKNRSAAYCKVVEVVAETTAPLLPTEDLLAKVPSDPGRSPPPPPPAPAAPVTEAVKESPPAPPAAEAPAPPAASVAPPPAAAPKAAERPLSPYTAYAGLKPPSSPTPSFSSGATSQAKESPPVAAAPAAPAPAAPAPAAPVPAAPATAKQRPLSPYTAYEGMKPPSSPTPSFSSGKAKDDASPSPPPPAASPDAATSTTAEAAATPPTSLGSSDNGAPTTAAPARPLSPYARYEDLKPPSTPTPSAPKV